MCNSIVFNQYAIPFEPARLIFHHSVTQSNPKNALKVAYIFAHVCKEWRNLALYLLPKYYSHINFPFLRAQERDRLTPLLSYFYSSNYESEIKKVWFDSTPASVTVEGNEYIPVLKNPQSKHSFEICASNSNRIYYAKITQKKNEILHSLMRIDFFKEEKFYRKEGSTKYTLRKDRIVSIQTSPLSCVAFVTENNTDKSLNVLYKGDLKERIFQFNPNDKPLHFEMLGTTLFVSQENVLYYSDFFSKTEKKSKLKDFQASYSQMTFEAPITFLRSVHETQCLVIVTDKPQLYSFKEAKSPQFVTDWVLHPTSSHLFKTQEIAFLEVLGPWIATVFKNPANDKTLNNIFFDSPLHPSFLFPLPNLNVFSFEKTQNVLLCDTSNFLIFISLKEETKEIEVINEFNYRDGPLPTGSWKKTYLLSDGRVAMFEENLYHIFNPYPKDKIFVDMGLLDY